MEIVVFCCIYQMFRFWATVNGMCFKIWFPTVHCQYTAIWLCVRLCVYVTERESEILYFDLISYNCKLKFSELSFVFSSVCRFLGICYVANHIVCKCEQLYFFTLTHMSLLSFSCLKSSSTKLNWLVESRHSYLIPQSRLLSLSTTFAIYFYKCPLSELDIVYS